MLFSVFKNNASNGINYDSRIVLEGYLKVRRHKVCPSLSSLWNMMNQTRGTGCENVRPFYKSNDAS